METIKQRVIDINKQSWLASLNESVPLESYKAYKKEKRLEIFMTTIKDDKYRKALTKFRVSSHDLLIEKGRHLNISQDDRTCKYCTMNIIENEYSLYHFLLVCPHYFDIKRKYLK